MKITEVKKLAPKERFVYWIKEREVIRLKKGTGKRKPWTDDEILQSYRFCNVRRMDDKVSKWLYEEWYQRYFDHPNMLAACVIARHFNKPETLGCITGHVFGKPYRPDIALKVIQEMKKAGHTVYSAAYMIHADKTADKSEMVINRVVQPFIDNPPAIDRTSIERSVNAILGYWNIGSFMAGQIIADYRWAVTGEWKDRNSWAAIGPGSERGINRYFGRPTKERVTQTKFNGELQTLIKETIPRLSNFLVSKLEAIDYQNCLCEFDKYCRVLLDEGKRPKQKYPGAA